MSARITRAFRQQRRHAKRRGIPFKFTFEEWVTWWETNLGPDWFSLRGRRSDQYCMGRRNDVGAYQADNVLCITSSKNLSDVARPPAKPKRILKRVRGKLNPVSVKEIYLMKGTQVSIAEKYEVSERLVRSIKNKTVWRNVLTHL